MKLLWVPKASVISFYDFDDYERLVVGAKAADPRAYLLVLLGAEAGLRSGEIRRLRLANLDLEGRWVRIEQSKGLKDRLVCLSGEVVTALGAYLAVRGPGAGDYVFLYRHRPLSIGYCGQRLRTLGKRCGVRATPHQLRCTCATLLLNAGAPILTVQAVPSLHSGQACANNARPLYGPS